MLEPRPRQLTAGGETGGPAADYSDVDMIHSFTTAGTFSFFPRFSPADARYSAPAASDDEGDRPRQVRPAGGLGAQGDRAPRATGVCSTTKIDLVRSLGADEVIDYTREDFTRGSPRYDVIFQLAGTASPSACTRALTPNGTLVLSSGEGRLAGIDRVARALVSSPFVPQRLRGFLTKETTADLVTLAELVEAGKVTPVIDRAYPLGEVTEAISYLEEGHARGKVVITV
ncbi:MAG: NAD(P)-dependent alcohol dehydrogenase [Gaiellaceae bacterium]